MPMAEFVEQDAERPHIQLVVVLAMIYHFRCHILQRATERVALPFVHLAVSVEIHLTFTRPPEVTNLQHVVIIDEQILRLKIAVNEAIFVQKIDTGHRLDKEIKCRILRKALFLADKREQVAFGYVLHD